MLARQGDRRALALANAAREEIATARLSPVLEAQARADLGHAYLEMAKRDRRNTRTSSVPASPLVLALAEFDESAATWQRQPLASTLAIQRDRALQALNADRAAALALVPR
ncbi:MAG: hypothetical protein R2712_23790 [Vicinamibacterales bacterium]